MDMLSPPLHVEFQSQVCRKKRSLEKSLLEKERELVKLEGRAEKVRWRGPGF